MPLEQLRSDILEDREKREVHLQSVFQLDLPSTILLSLNIPGDDKTPPGSLDLFKWGQKKIETALAATMCCFKQDRAGFFAIYSCEREPEFTKQKTAEIESIIPAARLLDIDIYGRNQRQLSRTVLGYSRRSCYVCDHPAMDCIRTKKHAKDEIQQAAKKLLAEFKSR